MSLSLVLPVEFMSLVLPVEFMSLVLPVEFMSLVCTRMPGESCCSLCDVSWVLINSLVYWFLHRHCGPCSVPDCQSLCCCVFLTCLCCCSCQCCSLFVWSGQGLVMNRAFSEMKFKTCPTESFAHEQFKKCGVGHYWDQAFSGAVLETAGDDW